MYKLLLALLASTLAACAQTGSATQPPAELNACTMDVMQCPDGSWSGRSGPKCEFKCPETPSR